MKKILVIFLVCFTHFSFAQTKNCDFEINDVTDTTSVKVLPEKIMNENIFGGTTSLLSFKLYEIDGVLGLNFQYIQKSKDFLNPYCIDKNTKVYLELNNGKQVKLINSVSEESCNEITYDAVNKNNIRILNGYFNFTKENFEYLKTEKVMLFRIESEIGNLSFVLTSKIDSEIIKKSFMPEQFFIEALPCFGF
ncbi:hypothetical protein RF683_04510 [Flavobacterium sp. 20NA77.7]|uniref:Uncharacterized protein n=1 Tax=Flavobacterium nakdongensis TaxID=3073563 RepID=A0ABY9RBT0_9FLAO|nr:hypothetical protein [Flavobacterium sp. 20NA77.7]WMW78710.1 hypothetical protein RF683_04510 [Flavobacterium sp. 20NA77.7]